MTVCSNTVNGRRKKDHWSKKWFHVQSVQNVGLKLAIY